MCSNSVAKATSNGVDYPLIEQFDSFIKKFYPGKPNQSRTLLRNHANSIKTIQDFIQLLK